MSVGVLVERLVAAGISIAEASEIIAAAFAAGLASAEPQKSVGARRQQRYRDRHKSVTNRNESVTTLRVVAGADTVTERNESVTNRNDVTPFSLSIEEDTKKEKKKEREAKRKPRYAIPTDLKLTEEMRQFALGRGIAAERIPREFEKFIAYHQAEGKLSADWFASWRRWVMNAIEYDRKRQHAEQSVRTQVDGRL